MAFDRVTHLRESYYRAPHRCTAGIDTVYLSAILVMASLLAGLLRIFVGPSTFVVVLSDRGRAGALLFSDLGIVDSVVVL